MRHRIVTASVLAGLFLVTVAAGRAAVERKGESRCTWDGNRAVGREFPVVSDTVAADIPELPLPPVSDTLRTPAARAGYVIEHFWDALDFADTLHTHDRDFMEQAFANYITLFPIVDTAVLGRAVNGLVSRAVADAESLSLLWETAEKYLYEQDSPAYSEEYYRIFADALVSAPLRDYEKLRLKAQREAMQKNRVGTRAADFAFETLGGERIRLSDFAAGQPLLLFFYDPECAHCMEVVAELSAMEPLQRAVAAGDMAVLAVYAGWGSRDRELWHRTADKIPASWTAGYDNGTIFTQDLYVLRNMPALYLLDAAGRVMAKDTTAARLAELLGRPE